MIRHRINTNTKIMQMLLVVFITTVSLGTPLQAVDLPLELPLWEKPPKELVIRDDVKEQVRFNKARSASPSGSNRVFSSVSSPTYIIHRPSKPNGVGLVICPGGDSRDVWLSDSNIIRDK